MTTVKCAEWHEREARLIGLMLEATAELREELATRIQRYARLRDGKPQPGSLSGEGRACVDPLARLVRRLEAEVGRPVDGLPGWLDAVLDGELAL